MYMCMYIAPHRIASHRIAPHQAKTASLVSHPSHTSHPRKPSMYDGHVKPRHALGSVWYGMVWYGATPQHPTPPQPAPSNPRLFPLSIPCVDTFLYHVFYSAKTSSYNTHSHITMLHNSQSVILSIGLCDTTSWFVSTIRKSYFTATNANCICPLCPDRIVVKKSRNLGIFAQDTDTEKGTK
ncbi:hypothetical protein P171DRAFT_55096 [Karstenula rhodostoma CBS 690.94]|uniref:Uncharacterized protein n=1 Tax=Karstenula rhodostoma CBS 690.94 TaxID=1392251 RepID=A0A9P4PDI5_9PLEO|nr:hypothetical protein P171DRAFT_55096 [Karstenula rhodostoma CBS 690.94]